MLKKKPKKRARPTFSRASCSAAAVFVLPPMCRMPSMACRTRLALSSSPNSSRASVENLMAATRVPLPVGRRSTSCRAKPSSRRQAVSGRPGGSNSRRLADVSTSRARSMSPRQPARGEGHGRVTGWGGERGTAG